MIAVYRDAADQVMTRDEVHRLTPDNLGPRSGIAVRIMPDETALYDAVAETMVETIIGRRGEKTTMILPVGPIGQYPVFARKVVERNVDCRNLWTFNMDEFLDRNGRTIPQSHPMSFRRIMMESFYNQLPENLRMPLDQMHFPGSLLRLRKTNDNTVESQTLTVWSTPVEAARVTTHTV